MRGIRTAAAAGLAFGLSVAGLSALADADAPPRPRVEVVTNAGTFVIELWPEKAPRTVNNFLRYVRRGFYDGTIFHRVVKNFVVQGGALTEDLEPKATLPPIPPEANAANARWTVAMARGSDPNSATSQFYVNLTDNRSLDEAGYTVFGRVVEGTAVVEQISRVPVRRRGRGLESLPVTPVVMKRVALLAPPPAIPVPEGSVTADAAATANGEAAGEE